MANISFESLIEMGVSWDDAYDYTENHGKVQKMLWTDLDEEEERWAREYDEEEVVGTW